MATYFHASLPNTGVPAFISDILAIPPLYTQGQSVRVVGRVLSYDPVTSIAVVVEPRCTKAADVSGLLVDSSLVGEEDFGVGSLVMLVGELEVGELEERAALDGTIDQLDQSSSSEMSVGQMEPLERVSELLDGSSVSLFDSSFKENESVSDGLKQPDLSCCEFIDNKQERNSSLKGLNDSDQFLLDAMETDDKNQSEYCASVEIGDCNRVKSDKGENDLQSMSKGIVLRARIAICVDRIDFELYKQGVEVSRNLSLN